MGSRSCKENNHVAITRKNLSKSQKLVHVRPTTSYSSHLAQETNKIQKHYMSEMLRYELDKSQENFRDDFLKRHKITPEIRARMVR